MYHGGTNQEPKLQRSSKTVREEQERWQKTTLQSRRVCKKQDLISSVERSHPSKLSAFLSRQIHHIKQWDTSLQKSMLRCCPNLPCQDSNNSITLWGIGFQTNKTPMTTTHKLWGNEAEDDPLTSHNSYTYSNNQELAHVFCKCYLLLKSYLRKKSMKRKLPLEEPSIAISFFKGRIRE